MIVAFGSAFVCVGVVLLLRIFGVRLKLWFRVLQ